MEDERKDLLESIGLHECRHTYVSLMFKAAETANRRRVHRPLLFRSAAAEPFVTPGPAQPGTGEAAEETGAHPPETA